MRGVGTALVAAVLVVALAGVSLAGAAGGDLDPRFGEGGKVVTPAGPLAFALAVALQPDGRIVVGGYGVYGGGASHGVLARYLPEGSLDGTFGDGGTVVVGSPGGVHAVASRSDRRIVVATADGGVARYRPDGSLDRSFGAGGAVPTPLPGRAVGGPLGGSMLLQPDGRVVVAAGAAAEGGGREIQLARLRQDGTADPTFGRNGTVRTSADWAMLAAALAPDGKIVVAGQWLHANKQSSADAWPVELVVARYSRTGTLDVTFGRGGVARHRLDPSEAVMTAVAVQRDGRIVVGGRSGTGGSWSPQDCCGAVWRLLPNGSLDRTFGVDGKAVTRPVFEDAARRGSRVYGVQALAVDRGGRIVVTSLDDVLGSRFGLARFTADGRPDRRFGRDGGVTTSFVGFARPFGLALQPDGKIVLTGRTGPGFSLTQGPGAIALARYLVPPCVVPNLRTRTQQGAATVLRNSGCALGRVTSSFSSDVARGRVISQQHRPLTSLPEDTAVAIVVSRGSRG